MDWNVNTAMNLFWLLPGMNGKSWKSIMSDWKIIFLLESLEFDFRLNFIVKHFWRKY